LFNRNLNFYCIY